MIGCLAARTHAARTRRAIVTALHWAAGPMHPPVRLRRAIISALIQPPSPPRPAGASPGREHFDASSPRR